MPGSDVLGGVVLRMTLALRQAGVPVSTGEAVDAARALEVMDAGEKGQVRAALRATLVKRERDVDTFERAFDAVTHAIGAGPARMHAVSTGPRSASAGGSVTGDPDAAMTSLLEDLVTALRNDDTEALRSLAALAVDVFGGIGLASQDSERALLYRILRGLDLARILQRAIRAQDVDAEDTEVLRALGGAEISARADAFRRLLARELRRRLDEKDFRDGIGLTAPTSEPEDLPILGASPSDLAAMQRALRPLARKLAVRGARRIRLTHHGRLDVRHTIRKSLSTGGLPLEPAWRRPRTTRPELVVLCDVSGSVAEFARFTLALMSAMSSEFSAMRCFAFVDGVDEVTSIVAESGGALMPGHVLARTDVVWHDGHSDYGRVFQQFAGRFSHVLTPRASLVITGDARSNHRAPNAVGLASIARTVREVHWLNPEPKDRWNTGDSIMDHYARSCDSVHEVRTLRQLEMAALEIAVGLRRA
ncbi:MAG TPA: VWA domain-containing protein [Candidatus Dormibacteraeota bacterium]